MLVLFWNARGLGKPAKPRMTMEVSVGAEADVVCLCETRLSRSSLRLTYALGAGRFDRWMCEDSLGASGGILISFNSSSYGLIKHWIGGFSLSVVVRDRKNVFY